MANAALILAAGRGARIQSLVPDKILAPLAGRPAFVYSIDAFIESRAVSIIAIIYRDEKQRMALQNALAATKQAPPAVIWVAGGKERQESVLAGLRSLPKETNLVFIHDAARPLVTPAAIRSVASHAEETGAACLARPVTDTIKEVAFQSTDKVTTQTRLRTLDRSRLWAVETPQAFKHSLILQAYEEMQAGGRLITDDTGALEGCGHPVALVESSAPNPKLTMPGDLIYLEYLLKNETESLQ